MRILQVFFFLIFFFFTRYMVTSKDNCSYSRCNVNDRVRVQFPFILEDDQQESCGYPGFNLTCNIMNKTVIKLGSWGEFLVRDIDYATQEVILHDQDNCLPKRLINMNLTGSPLKAISYETFYFFNCTSNVNFPFMEPITCLSTSNYSVLAVASMDRGRSRFNSCEFMTTAMVPTTTEYGYQAKINDDLHLVWYTPNCAECVQLGGECGFKNSKSSDILCFDLPRRGPGNNARRKKVIGNNASSKRKKVIALTTGIGGVLAAAILFFLWWSKHSTTKSILFWKRSKKEQILMKEFLKNYGSLAPKRYNYSDIKKITNSFKDKVGQGGYGLVYKGELLDGRLVAVKLLNKAKDNGEEFINEVGSITRTSHVNVVSLLGFCFEGSKRALIYEFMSNGSLEKFIYDSNPLKVQSQIGWEILYQITIGVARGLEYLHCGCNTRILHFDIKPHNILLDHDFTPKISDFGLAKLCQNKESVISMLDARGTAGYIAPEVFNRSFGGVSHKSDVYSYGMMVLEIVGRRKNINVQVDHTSEIYFPQWIYKRLIQDADLELYGVTSPDETEIAKKMIVVALWCIQTNPMDRPSMSKVVEMFEGRNEILQIPPKPYLCSPPRSPVRSSNT